METLCLDRTPFVSLVHNYKPNAVFFKTLRFFEKHPEICLVLGRPLVMDKARSLPEGNIFQHPNVHGLITHRRFNDYGIMRYDSTDYATIFDLECDKLKHFMLEHRNCAFVVKAVYMPSSFVEQLKAAIAKVQAEENLIGVVVYID